MSTRPVGDILRDLRTSKGTSLRSAAADLGVDASYLSKVERGQKPLNQDLREKAADYYDAQATRLAVADGDLPADILRILADHPEAVNELRKRYGSP